jgi:diguanylate cyclase (GGDEF)-like protein
LAWFSHRRETKETRNEYAMPAPFSLIDNTAMGSGPSRPATTRVDQGISPDWHTGRALEVSTALQTTLDLDHLLNLFSAEVQKNVSHDGLTYLLQEQGLQLSIGNKSRHSCSYRVLIAGLPLGELEFTRSRRFREEDYAMLEYLIATLLYPLRNALMYRQAIATALQDPLTGLNNRKSLECSLRREVDLARRHGNSLGLVVIDIDCFKSINDRYGHLTGDSVLRNVADCVAACMRSTDMLFRYGGEEFVALLSNTNVEGAQLLAERIRRTVERLSCGYGDTTLGVTVSLGVACLSPDDNDEALFQRADAALYRAKHDGRNRVVVAE